MPSAFRYDEFHPFLFAQHAKSPYLEFDTFDKVHGCMMWMICGFLLTLGVPVLKSNVISVRLWMSSSRRWKARRLTWRLCSWRNMLWRSWKMLRRTTSRDWRHCTKHRSFRRAVPPAYLYSQLILTLFDYVCKKKEPLCCRRLIESRVNW